MRSIAPFAPRLRATPVLGILLFSILSIMPTGVATAQTMPTEQTFDARFILTTHTGQAVTDQHFRNHFRLVFFGYTHCPDVCPASLQTIAEVMDLLGPDGERVKPLFISLDPERDTPSVLAEYVVHFHREIIGLTGSREMIERLTNIYKIKSQRVPASDVDKTSYTIDHTASLLFLDPSGLFVQRFPPGTPAQDIASAVRASVLKTGRRTTG